MVEVINKSCNWIRNHFQMDKVNKFSIIVILFYYYVGLMSYITVPIKPIYRLFTSSSSVAVVVRAIMTAVICIYCLLVVVVNKEKVQWRWAVVFLYVLLFTLLSTALSPQTYNYIYVSESNYGVVYWVQASTGFNRLLTMFLSSISDFAMAFCFLFILPIVINNRKQILLLTLPIVSIGLMECVYSSIVERGEYVKLINMVDPQYSGYNINIGATFGNKEDWGAFSTVAFCSAIASFFSIKGGGLKKIIIRISLAISAVVIFVFTIASLCKTAIGAQIICIVIISFYLLVASSRRSKLLFTFCTFLIVGIYLAFIMFYLVPAFHSNGLLEKIYRVIDSYIISPIIGGASKSRTEIWSRFINNLRTYNVFFGLSKGGVSTYSQVITVEGQSSIHNGLAYFFGSYGVLGFSVYAILISLVIIRILRNYKIDTGLVFVTMGFFSSAMVFSLSESEVLLVSGSNPIFIFNILICVFPSGFYKKELDTLTDCRHCKGDLYV